MKEVPEDKIVVLGLVPTKRPELEKPRDLMVRIRAASRFLPLDQLALSPQCGFASSIIGNRISAEEQKNKLRVVVETAKASWG